MLASKRTIYTKGEREQQTDKQASKLLPIRAAIAARHVVELPQGTFSAEIPRRYALPHLRILSWHRDPDVAEGSGTA